VLKPELWAVVAITALAAVLRFATISHQSYWIDESITVHELHLSFGGLMHSVRVNETTPPLYFVLAWLWAKVFGTGEAGLRSLSAVAGIATIPVTYLAARELVSRRAGLLAAVFCAVSPFMIWYSQEARSYMLFGFFCALSVWLWARARNDPTPRNLVLWAIAAALTVLTHFFAGFLIAPEALWLLYSVRTRATWIACGVIVAVQAAMLPLVIGDTSHPLGWINQFPLSTRIQQVPVDLGLSGLYQSSLVTDGLLGSALLAAIVASILVIGGGRREHSGAIAAAVLAAVVVFVPLLLAAFGRDYVVPRNFMPAWVPLAIILAAAATAPRARLAGAALAVVVIGGFVYAGIRIEGNSAYQRPNWRGVAHALGTARGPRAIVAFAGTFATEPLSLYLPRTAWSWTGEPSGVTTASVTEIDVVGNRYQPIARPLPAGVSLIATRGVDGYVVDRFALNPALNMAPMQLQTRAAQLLRYAHVSGSAILLQPERSH
jgi:mannosyltransferase